MGASDETLYDYLERRERELTHQIAAIRGQLEPRESELADVQAAKRKLSKAPAGTRMLLGVPMAPPQSSLEAYRLHGPHELGPPPGGAVDLGSGLLSSPFEDMTIKQLIVRALMDQFEEGGASPAQLRGFIREAYGRVVDRSSMAPQLSRLRDEGRIEQIEGTGKWLLTPINHSSLETLIR